jgi:hypothetical protein
VKISKKIGKMIISLIRMSTTDKTIIDTMTTQTVETSDRPIIDAFIDAWYLNYPALKNNKNSIEVIVNEFIDNYIETLDKTQIDMIFYEYGFFKLIDYMQREVTKGYTDEQLICFSDNKTFWAHCALFNSLQDVDPCLKHL